MKKNKVVLGILALTLVVALVAGCGSTEKPAVNQPAAGHDMKNMPANGEQQAAGHDMKNMQMPKDDPMPMMKDMDQQMKDLMKQVKSGQTMEAQKTAGQIVGLTDKVMPHMMDNGLKDRLKQSATDIKDTVNAGKMDPGAMESKLKAMQEIMMQTTSHLQTMTHK